MGILFLTGIALLLLPSIVIGGNVTVDDNEMGMGILYDMVNVFLGDVIHKEKLSESFLNLSTIFVDGHFDSDQINDWKEWSDYLIGFAVCAAIGILFIIVMTITGFIFCCCRLCGKCGAKPGKNADKKATCKRRSYCTVLIILNTIALAGIICAFVCNSLMYKHLQNDQNDGAVNLLRQSLQNVGGFIENSVNGASAYITNEYDVTSAKILQDVNDTASGAVDKVLDMLNATALLAQAKEISKDANDTKDQLDEVSSLLADLHTESVQMQNNLTEIKNDIQDVCVNSPSSSWCSRFKPADYNTNANFSSLKDLSDESTKVGEALDMSKYISQAEGTLNDAKTEAKKSVQDKTAEAQKAVEDVRKEIQTNVNKMQDEKNRLLRRFLKIYSDMNNVSEDVDEYSKYGYYAVIGVCCMYLLIIVLYYIGILFGMCGEKPGHGAPCCNTGHGANFLISGVAFTFIFSWILMLICLILFVIGGPVHTEVCRYFEDHDPSQIEPFNDAFVKGLDLSEFYDKVPADKLNLSLSNILSDCQRNRPVYSALKLDGIVDLDEATDISTLKTKLDDLKSSTLNIKNISIINDELREKLNKLANSGLENITFNKYFEELAKGVTVGELSTLASLVYDFANRENDSTYKSTLQKSAQRLQSLSSSLPEITGKVARLNGTLTTLQKQSTIKESILKLIDNMNKSQENFNSQKDQLVQDAISELADETLKYANDSIMNVKREVRESKFGCQDLSTALYTMSDVVCVLVVNPMNGLWFSFGWCLFFFVPCLIFAVLLATQYRRKLEDDKEFDDPNYLMYGGPNPDTIPLTSVDQPRRSNGYQHQQYPSGMSNAGYRDDSKLGANVPPPPYEEHMHPGAWIGDIPSVEGRTSRPNRHRYSNGRDIY